MPLAQRLPMEENGGLQALVRVPCSQTTAALPAQVVHKGMATKQNQDRSGNLSCAGTRSYKAEKRMR